MAQGLLGTLEVGKLPALGWNSWNAYACNINEEHFLSAARKLVDLGLKVSLDFDNLPKALPLTTLRTLAIIMSTLTTAGPRWIVTPVLDD